MFLTLPTVRKLFRDCFQGQSPIRVDAKSLTQTAEQWQRRISGLDGIRLSHHAGDRDARARTICRFTINDPHVERQVFRSDEVRLEYDQDFFLQLSVRRANKDPVVAKVSCFDELDTLVRKVHSRYARAEATRRKQQRLRDFKSKAMIAKIRKLASEKHFEFAVESEHAKLRLFIRLSEKNVAEISIPFDRFEDSVSQVESAIQSLKSIHEAGLHLKMTTDGRRTRSLSWISPSADGFAKSQQ